MIRFGLMFAFLFVALAGCEKRVGPDVAWKRFVDASRKGDATTAWTLLSKQTQEEFTRAAVKVAAARGLKEPKDGRSLMLSSRSSLVPAPTVIEARFESDDEASVRVLDEDAQRGSVRAVREDGEWRFDLTSVLPTPERP